MRVLFAASEIYPFLKTGGLGDVAAALPEAMALQGADVRLLLPGYPAIADRLSGPRVLCRLPAFFGTDDARMIAGTLPSGLKAYLVDSPHFYDRSGPYVDENGIDWPDNHLRFAALARAAVDVAGCDSDSGWKPDILHGNDWQCGLIPAYARSGGRDRPATVMTIHNIAYQGLFPPSVLPDLGLPPASFSMNGVEYYGKVGFLKAGLYYADALTTVSPSYAHEIQEPEQGCGLDGLLKTRSRDLTGILNGIDDAVWNPSTDTYLAARYDAANIKLKSVNKAALLQELNVAPRQGRPVFSVISRLVPQKGIDLLVSAAPEILRRGAALIILGTGDQALEESCRALAAAWPGRVAAVIGYDEELAHRIMGGTDAVVVPSRFEPCGLVQMYGLHYGTLPVVRCTGGLADSVTGETGFLFGEATAPALAEALNLAVDTFGKPSQWKKMQRQALARNFGWAHAARRYVDIYKQCISHAYLEGRPPISIRTGK